MKVTALSSIIVYQRLVSNVSICEKHYTVSLLKLHCRKANIYMYIIPFKYFFLHCGLIVVFAGQLAYNFIQNVLAIVRSRILCRRDLFFVRNMIQ